MKTCCLSKAVDITIIDGHNIEKVKDICFIQKLFINMHLYPFVSEKLSAPAFTQMKRI